jgi:hypothetical protein
MNRKVRPLSVLALLVTAAVLPTGPATAGVTDCPFPTITKIYAYQQTPEATMLSGYVHPSPGCPSSGILTRTDGSAERPVGEGFFELPLNSRSGDWYLSSLTVMDRTMTYQPVAPYLVKVLRPTRLTSTQPASVVPYGQQVTASGVLEGWTAATGWQPLAGRPVSVATGNGIDGHPPVLTTTDQAGAYRVTVPAYDSFDTGSPSFAGDETWMHAGGFSDVQVHGLVTVRVSDDTPAVGQRIRISGTVAPAGVPVWLEQFVEAQWVKVSPTVSSDSDGRYVLSHRPQTRGVQQYRVWNDGTEPESRTGVLPFSKEFTLAVHR